MNRQGVLSGEACGDPEIERRDFVNPSIGIGYESDSFEPDVVGHLRKASLKNQFELPQPEDCDQAQWYGDKFIIRWTGQPERTLSDPGENTQQSELVRGRFRVSENNMSNDRQRSGAVIRQSKDQTCPFNAGAVSNSELESCSGIARSVLHQERNSSTDQKG